VNAVGTHQKRSKLARIAPLLRCPLCYDAVRVSGRSIACPNAHAFRAEPNAYDFLTDDLRASSGVEATENVSAHTYDPIALDIIARREFVLDAGAGLRDTYFPGVVNMEIVPYETTDVLAVGERLPFADASFDAVLSLNVLEHLRDPFAAAREIVRVLKPGGELYCVLPFMQPFHGYPNHYYNATSAGLRNLFATLAIERAEVAGGGTPIFALTWFLQWWLNALPPQAAERFASKTVGELAVSPMGLLGESFVTDLSADMRERLACANMILARKP
jgi:SAM-dependent methyltransferase